jgi:hypothetical protein
MRMTGTGCPRLQGGEHDAGAATVDGCSSTGRLHAVRPFVALLSEHLASFWTIEKA